MALRFHAPQTQPPGRQSLCAAFAGKEWSSDRLLVGDEDAIICQQCATLAVAVIAKVRTVVGGG
jgi:hypothetical protein